MSTLSNYLAQYSDLTYLVELIALGLVALALLAVTFSILTRLKSGKREQKKMLSLRRSAEKDKKTFDQTLTEISNIGKKIKNDGKEADMHLERAAKKVREAEQHAESVANIEVDMKQLVDGTTERMVHIQEHWEFLLKETTESMSAINANLKEGLDQTAQNNEQTTEALNALSHSSALVSASDDESSLVGSAINEEIKETLDLTLKESKELLAQIKDYQQQAKKAFTSYTNTLSGFETQAHEQFDAVFNTADVARQELNANLDESREYLKIFRKNNRNSKKDHDVEVKGVSSVRKDRPLLGANDAETLTDKDLISKEYYGDTTTLSPDGDEDKNLISLFTKFKQSSS